MKHQPNIDPETGEVLTDTIIDTLSQWPKVITGLDPLVEMEARGKLALKLSKAYQAVEAVIHDDNNTEHKYSFASAEAIYRTVRKGLSEVGLAVVPFMGQYSEVPILKKDNSGERRGAYLLVEFDFCLIDSETGYTVVIPWRGEVMEYGDKAFNKASTNATKYMLRTLFLLPTDKDEDSDRDSHNDRPQTRQNNPPRSRESERPPHQPTNKEESKKEEVDPETARKRREANKVIDTLGLRGDVEGLKAFSSVAKAAGLDPLSAFYELTTLQGGLDKWSDFNTALKEFIDSKNAAEADDKKASPTPSEKSSDGDPFQNGNVDASNSKNDETEKTGGETSSAPSTPNPADKSTEAPKDSPKGSDSSGASTPNSGGSSKKTSANDPAAALRAEFDKATSKVQTLKRLDALGLSVDQAITDVLKANEKAKLVDLVTMLDELEARGR